MKLLIADDEQKIRTGMASLDWDSIGITEVSLAVNGVEAKKLLEQEPFDIMICDIKMPGLTGTGSLRAGTYIGYFCDSAVRILGF